MFFGLAEMRIVIILLETGVQLMTNLILVLFHVVVFRRQR